MNKILTLIFITSIFSANLEVDGGLKVNGPIESQTIDSLLTIISQLENQLALMQNADNKLETRIYQISDININYAWNCTELFNISSLIGFVPDIALVKLIDIKPTSGNFSSTNGFGAHLIVYKNSDMDDWFSSDYAGWVDGENLTYEINQVITTNQHNEMCIMGANSQINLPINADITFAVTALFPEN